MGFSCFSEEKTVTIAIDACIFLDFKEMYVKILYYILRSGNYLYG